MVQSDRPRASSLLRNCANQVGASCPEACPAGPVVARIAPALASGRLAAREGAVGRATAATLGVAVVVRCRLDGGAIVPALRDVGAAALDGCLKRGCATFVAGWLNKGWGETDPVAGCLKSGWTCACVTEVADPGESVGLGNFPARLATQFLSIS